MGTRSWQCGQTNGSCNFPGIFLGNPRASESFFHPQPPSLLILLSEPGSEGKVLTKETWFPLLREWKSWKLQVGAIFAPTRFSLVRISIRHLVADRKSLIRELWGWGWGSKSDPQSRSPKQPQLSRAFWVQVEALTLTRPYFSSLRSTCSDVNGRRTAK